MCDVARSLVTRLGGGRNTSMLKKERKKNISSWHFKWYLWYSPLFERRGITELLLLIHLTEKEVPFDLLSRLRGEASFWVFAYVACWRGNKKHFFSFPIPPSSPSHLSFRILPAHLVSFKLLGVGLMSMTTLFSPCPPLSSSSAAATTFSSWFGQTLTLILVACGR